MRAKHLLLLLILPLIITSCKYLNPNRMLQTGEFYPYAQFDTVQADKDYKIAPDDILEFKLYSNDGATLIEPAAGGGNMTVGTTFGLSVTIEKDGFAKLPVLGRTYLQGLTQRQAELFLEEKFAIFFNKPFVLLNVNNRKVVIFSGSKASIYPLKNSNTTLLELLALFGGIPQDGKAFKVKLIRGDLKNPQVYIIDLSNLEGIKYYDLVLQSNDIVYIETRRNLVSNALQIVQPYLAVISTLLLTVTLVNSLSK